MTLTLSEEQAFLKDTAKKFAQERTPTTHFREIRDTENPECFDRKIWQEMAAQESLYLNNMVALILV